MNKIQILKILLVLSLTACSSKEAYPTAPAFNAQASETQKPADQQTVNIPLAPTITPEYKIETPNPTPTVIDDPLSNTKVGDGCLPPIIETDRVIVPEGIIPTPRAEVLLPIGWEEISKIPEEFKAISSYIQLMRHRSGFDEIWVGIYNGSSSVYVTSIYRTDTKEWRDAPNPPGLSLFLDGDNNVWSDMYTEDKTAPRFYRLDQETNQFIPVMDKDNLLGGGHIASSVKIDSAGTFWFLFRDTDDNSASRISLYSFNPFTQKAERHSIGVGFDNLVIDENNNIYLLQNSSLVVKFNPATGSLHSVTLPGEDIENGISLFIDHKGRLWVSDIARFDQAVFDPKIGVPTLIPRSPIFIYFFASYGRYFWHRPPVLLESKDDRLWYSSPNGNAWFNSATEEWCLFTTYGSNIEGDSNHNLWMIADDALYRYDFAR